MTDQPEIKHRRIPKALWIGLIIIIVVGMMCVIASYTPGVIMQLTHSGSHAVKYTINSDNLYGAMITYLDESGNKISTVSSLPFSITVYLKDGDTAELTAQPAMKGLLVCFIDIDDTLNWRYSSGGAEVRCSGIVGEK